MISVTTAQFQSCVEEVLLPSVFSCSACVSDPSTPWEPQWLGSLLLLVARHRAHVFIRSRWWTFGWFQFATNIIKAL